MKDEKDEHNIHMNTPFLLLIVFISLLIGWGIGTYCPNKTAQEEYYIMGMDDGMKAMELVSKGESPNKAIRKHYKYKWLLPDDNEVNTLTGD